MGRGFNGHLTIGNRKESKFEKYAFKFFYFFVFILLIGLGYYFFKEKEVFYLQEESVNLLIDSDYQISLMGKIEQKDSFDYIFTSNNEEIVTVDNNGLVHAVGPGETTIIVKSKSSKNATTLKVNVDDSKIYSIDIEQDNIVLKENEKHKIQPLINGKTNYEVTINYSSTNKKVATVSKKGEIKAVSKGSAYIECKVKGTNLTSRVKVTVNSLKIAKETTKPTKTSEDDVSEKEEIVNKYVEVIDVSLSLSKNNVKVGEKLKATYKITPENATNKKVTFSSNNTDVATIDKNGNIIVLDKGQADIIVKTEDGNKTSFVTLYVKTKSVSSVKLNKTNTNLEEGSHENLFATISPNDATNKEVVWSSSNEDIVSVDQNGNLTGNKNGVANITVKTKDGNKTATCLVTVNKKKINVSSIALNKKTLSLVEGSSSSLVATISPSNATNQNISWTSTNTNSVTVDEIGNIKALKEGTSTIIVKTNDGNKTATCTVSVTKKIVNVTGIKLNKNKTNMEEGSTENLSFTITPNNASNKNVSWTSSNNSIVSVDNNGKLVAYKEGTATITVKTNDGSKTATCTVTVSKKRIKVTGIKLDKTTINLLVGEKNKLTPTITPNNATNQNIAWSSSNNNIVSVDEVGNIKALKEGTSKITVKTKDGNKTATCTVIVKAIKVKSVTLNKTNLTLGLHSTYELKATVLPNDASNKSLIWTSSNNKIVSVDSKGKIKALKEGTATITVKSIDGSKTATCKVVAKLKKVSSIALNKSSLQIKKGKTFKLKVSITPSDASNKSVSYTSDNSKVASVDSKGNIKAVGLGQATIKVKAKDGSNKSSDMKIVVVPEDKLIDVRKKTYTIYKKAIGTIESGKYKHIQNFAISNLGKDNEVLYLITVENGNINAITYPELSKSQINSLTRTMIYKITKNDINKENNRQRMYLELSGHGQAVDLEKNSDIFWINANAVEPRLSNDRWWGVHNGIMRIKYTNNNLGSKISPLKKIQIKDSNNKPLTHLTPAIDDENNLIAISTGKWSYIYNLKDFRNGKLNLIYKFKRSSYYDSDDGKKTGTLSIQGVDLSNGYYYHFRGATNENAYIEVFNMLGKSVYHMTIGKEYEQGNKIKREGEGMHIYDNKIYVGSVYVKSNSKYSGKVFDIAYFK